MATTAMVAGWFLQSALSVAAPFMTGDLGLSRTQLGLLFFVLAMAGALTAPVAGRWADRSVSSTMRRLFGSAALGLIVAATAVNLAWALLAALVGGIGLGASNPVSNKLVSWGVDPGRRGLALGIKQSGPFLGVILAGLFLPWAAGWMGWRWAVASTALLPVLALAAFSAPPGRLLPAEITTRESPLHGGTPPEVWWLAFTGFLVAMGSGICVAFIPLYAEQALGFTPASAGLAASVFGLVGVAGRIGWGARAERWRDPTGFLAWSALIGGAAGLMILAGRVAEWLLWAGVAVGGASMLAWHAVAWLAVLHRVEHGRVGSASGVIHRANLVGVAVGPPVAGWLTDRSGSYDPCWLLVTAVLGFAGAVLAWRARNPAGRRRHPAL